MSADLSSMDVGTVLRETRKKVGLSQGELAEKAGADRSYVSLLENNRKSPTLEMFIRLCRAMNCTPSKILALIERQGSD